MGKVNSDISQGLKVWISASKLEKPIQDGKLASIQCATPEKMALELLSTMFTETQLAHGNFTDTNGRWHLLDQTILQGIRRMLMK